ncbi:MAG: uracil-DNA glycosylase [Gemmatimonadaceae bacterium]
MDAKERLRIYLEQRRELGESELVLDALPVDDVLRMIGAPSVASSANKSQPKTVVQPVEQVRIEVPPVQQLKNLSEAAANSASAQPPAVPPARFDESVQVDWRSALKKAEANDAGNARKNASSDTNEGVGSAFAPKAKPAHIDAQYGAIQASQTSPNTELPRWLAALSIPAGLSVVPVFESTANDRARTVDSLTGLAAMIASCRACSLGKSATNAVPGEGNPNADFVCVGEAPGQTEDETGRPFVGESGQLLTKILEAIQLPREEVFICNVLKHRPPGNRNPQPDEVRACTPYLTRQLELLQPKVILALGTFAAQTLLNTQTAMGKLRGQVHRYQGIPLIVTYHPSALLRNANWKRPAWDDVRLARRILDAARAASSSTH